MEAALKRSGLAADDIDYVNAHGTSTPLGDEIELGAVQRLFGSAADKLSMSSTKSSIGHLLGAAGSVEAIFCILAMQDQIVPYVRAVHASEVPAPGELGRLPGGRSADQRQDTGIIAVDWLGPRGISNVGGGSGSSLGGATVTGGLGVVGSTIWIGSSGRRK